MRRRWGKCEKYEPPVFAKAPRIALVPLVQPARLCDAETSARCGRTMTVYGDGPSFLGGEKRPECGAMLRERKSRLRSVVPPKELRYGENGTIPFAPE